MRLQSFILIAACITTMACDQTRALVDEYLSDGGLSADGGEDVCIDNDLDSYGLHCAAGLDCDDTDESIHPDATEVCDNIDNDCDRLVDEELGKGQPCTIESGECTAPGTTVCAEGGGLICGAGVNTPLERCNNLDDDCNGSVDEGNPGGGDQCDTGLAGVCSAGLVTCTEGELVCVQVQGESEEVCNGLNDDCDVDLEGFNLVDEDELGSSLARTCYAGPVGTDGVGVCHGGTRTCSGGVYSGCVGQVVPHTEICDGLDNDCNGLTDDVTTGSCGCSVGATQECYAGPPETEGVGACHSGTQTCVPGGTSGAWGPCEGAVTPSPEACTATEESAVDEDCDGETDEDLMFGDAVVSLGAACERGIGGCRGQGTYECDPGRR